MKTIFWKTLFFNALLLCAVLLIVFGVTRSGADVNVKKPNEIVNDKNPNERKTLEMVFALDTTGSMGGLIEGAKQRIWGIVNEVMQSESRPNVRIGLVAYRDRDAVVYSFYANTRQSATLWGDYKLRLDYVRGTQQLYDVKRDPRETTNLIEREPEVARKLRDLLGKAWDNELNDHVVQGRMLRSFQRLCDGGDTRACAVLRGAAGAN